MLVEKGRDPDMTKSSLSRSPSGDSSEESTSTGGKLPWKNPDVCAKEWGHFQLSATHDVEDHWNHSIEWEKRSNLAGIF